MHAQMCKKLARSLFKDTYNNASPKLFFTCKHFFAKKREENGNAFSALMSLSSLRACDEKRGDNQRLNSPFLGACPPPFLSYSIPLLSFYSPVREGRVPCSSHHFRARLTAFPLLSFNTFLSLQRDNGTDELSPSSSSPATKEY